MTLEKLMKMNMDEILKEFNDLEKERDNLRNEIGNARRHCYELHDEIDALKEEHGELVSTKNFQKFFERSISVGLNLIDDDDAFNEFASKPVTIIYDGLRIEHCTGPCMAEMIGEMLENFILDDNGEY